MLVANFVGCICAKNYERRSAIDKVISITINSLLYFGSPGICATLTAVTIHYTCNHMQIYAKIMMRRCSKILSIGWTGVKLIPPTNSAIANNVVFWCTSNWLHRLLEDLLSDLKFVHFFLFLNYFMLILSIRTIASVGRIVQTFRKLSRYIWVPWKFYVGLSAK